MAVFKITFIILLAPAVFGQTSVQTRVQTSVHTSVQTEPRNTFVGEEHAVATERPISTTELTWDQTLPNMGNTVQAGSAQPTMESTTSTEPYNDVTVSIASASSDVSGIKDDIHYILGPCELDF